MREAEGGSRLHNTITDWPNSGYTRRIAFPSRLAVTLRGWMSILGKRISGRARAAVVCLFYFMISKKWVTLVLFVPLSFASLLLTASRADAQSAITSSFTFQGRLTDGGAPANGVYDLTFTLFPTNIGGVAVAGPITNAPTAVSNGLFTVLLDFGASAFPGDARWLEVAVRSNGVATSRIPLTPHGLKPFGHDLGRQHRRRHDHRTHAGGGQRGSQSPGERPKRRGQRRHGAVAHE